MSEQQQPQQKRQGRYKGGPQQIREGKPGQWRGWPCTHCGSKVEAGKLCRCEERFAR